ncbi:MAG: hypothetical protein WBC33_01660 [Conexibacter sp.]
MNVFRFSHRAAPVALLAGALLGLTTAASAKTVVQIGGIATPPITQFTTQPHGLTLTVDTFFTNDVPDTLPGTIQKAVVYFPHGSRVNAALFPSCSPAKLQRLHGASRACPRGSRLGGGFALGTAEGFESVTARLKVDVYNGPGGRSLLFYIFATNPITIAGMINASFQHINSRRWEYKLTLNVPKGLQEIGPEIFAAVRRFSVKVGATTTVREGGRTVRRSFIEALACPPGALVPVRGVFSFRAEPQVTQDGYIACGKR